MNDHEPFLNAIKAGGRDYAPRLVYADYLDEHGESDKAVYLRGTCEADRIDTEERKHGRSAHSIPGHAERVRFNTEVRDRIAGSDRLWLTRTDIDLAVPTGLSPSGDRAATEILDFLAGEETSYTGGCQTFYSPAEWREREEDFGTDSHLIVCHDGGCLSDVLGTWGDDEAGERLRQRLHAHGLFVEQCTEWYSAVYREDGE
jgi:uncharacterized protein (TIGR02996 family)